MATDISRMRLDPLSNYAGVELRQGAVLLDADANESTAIVDRRLRAMAGDTLGRARVSSTTPDAFRISLSGSDLLIGKGRMYVDGLLAENHGAGAAAFDALMGEATLQDAVAYAAQPYLPDPPALPTQGRHIVYLDTWYRDVSHVQAPDLTEIAVGVETSARIQAVWQVRVLDEAIDPNATCVTGATAWDALVAPSSGLLTSGTFDDPGVADPCELPPTGGYRGLENQLYRVEIHTPGQPGAGATFKWSRDNASVVVPVQAWVSDTELQLSSLGRDDVLGIKSGDWVEIIDDAREFAQQAGEMRRITVDPGTRRITFAGVLPAAMGSDPGGRHLRVVRWDQAGKVFRTDASGTPIQVDDLDASATGTIAVPAVGTTLLLENGITVAFDVRDAGRFRAGDFWVLAARTADASVERLDKAPPRGAHHHLARLALWDAGSGALTDCRQAWPPAAGGEDCACSVCVKPREANALQKAIDTLRAANGGTLCLDIGVYELERPLVLADLGSVRIVGKGSNTILRCAKGPCVVQLDKGCEDVVLTAFCMEMGESRAARGILRVANSRRVRAEQLTLRAPSGNDVAAIELRDGVDGLAVRDCAIAAPIGLRAPRGVDLTDLRVDDNTFACDAWAVNFDKQCSFHRLQRLRGNRVECSKGTALILGGRSDVDATFAIEENVITSPKHGIEATLNRLRIVGNTFQAPRGGGVAILFQETQVVEDLQVVGNRIAGFEGAIGIQASVLRAMIKQNRIDASAGIRIENRDATEQVSIDNNQMVVEKGAALVVVSRRVGLAVTGNAIACNGGGSAVDVEADSGTCTFADNQCDASQSGDSPAIRLRCTALVVTSNRIRGERDDLSFRLESQALTLLGNIVSGEIKPLDPPWAPLNLQQVPN